MHIIQFVVLTITLTVPCNNGDVRVAGGDGISYGRVEVCISGVWGTVCSDAFWDDTDADVVCKEQGFSEYGRSFDPNLSVI